ncbi:MAG: hypothetical protein NTY22_03130 [Proteobacteria bacterium]|nr:hypothetical protein [Pseudomonadota bacterium]
MLFNLLLLFTLAVGNLSAERVYVKIGSPEFKKPVIAINGKCVKEDNICPQIQDVMSILSSDMILSNAFIVLPKETMPTGKEKDNLAAWKVSGAEYLMSMDFYRYDLKIKLTSLSTDEDIIKQSV